MEETISTSHNSDKLITTRSGFAAFFLTVFCLGLGHLYSGELKKAVIFFVISNSFIVSFLYSLLCIPFSLGVQFILSFFIGSCFTLYVTIDAIISAAHKKNYVLKPYNKWYLYIGIILFVLFIRIPFERSIFTETYSMPTGSMENTIIIGDRVMANMMAYGIHIPYSEKYIFKLNKPKINDVIVFLIPENRKDLYSEEVIYSKRIAGGPGDTILIRNKAVYINGEFQNKHPNGLYNQFTLKKDYTNPHIFPSGNGWNSDNYGPLRIPQKGDTIKITPRNYEQWEFFVLRESHKIQISKDSIITIDDKARTNYIAEHDYYFVIGDNFDNSLDSRYFGFISKEKIIAKIDIIYWSWDIDIPFSQFGKRMRSIRWDRIGKLIE